MYTLSGSSKGRTWYNAQEVSFSGNALSLLVTDGEPADLDPAPGRVAVLGGVGVREIVPVTAVNGALGATNFDRGSGEQVVLAFAIAPGVDDATLNRMTIASAGELDVESDVGAVALYLDTNGDGVPDAGERIASQQYSAGEQALEFVLGSPMSLVNGANNFLITYEF